MTICNMYVVYGHFLYVMAIWYSLWSLGYIFPFWYVWVKKNLATLVSRVLRSALKKTEQIYAIFALHTV
jgi:hypothetical protein